MGFSCLCRVLVDGYAKEKFIVDPISKARNRSMRDRRNYFRAMKHVHIATTFFAKDKAVKVRPNVEQRFISWLLLVVCANKKKPEVGFL